MKWQVMGCWTAAALVLWMASADAAPPYRVPAQPVVHGGLVHGPTCGCDACHMACDPCCRPCILRVIPAVVHGVDKLLNNIFCCKRCYRPACGAGCDCTSKHGHGHGHGEWIVPDHAVPQVEPEAVTSPMSTQIRRSYQHWNLTPGSAGSASRIAPRPASPPIGSGLEGTSSVMKPKRTSSVPDRLPVRSTSLVRPLAAEEVEELEEDVQPVEIQELQPVRRTSYEPSSSPRIPKNPLRDN